MPINATTAVLQHAADGLTYLSETDAPWQAFGWPDATGEVTAAGVLLHGRHRPASQVEEQAIEEFLAPLVREEAWYGEEENAQATGYRGLAAVIDRTLTRAKVVRVGRRKQTVYVVGQAPEGGWAGLKTTAVET